MSPVSRLVVQCSCRHVVQPLTYLQHTLDGLPSRVFAVEKAILPHSQGAVSHQHRISTMTLGPLEARGMPKTSNSVASWLKPWLKPFWLKASFPRLVLVATMAGLLLHAVAGMPAGVSCSSRFAAVPLLPPSTPWAPSKPSLFALPLFGSCRTSWSSSRVATLSKHVLLQRSGCLLCRALCEELACDRGGLLLDCG